MALNSTHEVLPSAVVDGHGGTLDVTILMPCLNEAETLATCIRKARGALRESGLSGEVLVADNGSSDGSQQIAVEEGARLVCVSARGYGAALNAGILEAGGEFVLIADADDSYDFFALPRFIESLRNGNDLAMGNRFRDITPGAMPWLHRYVGNPVLSLIGRIFFNIEVRDFHCGIRAFRKDAILNLDLRTSGMEFASEMVVRAALAKLKIAEVPASLRPDGRSRRPHLKTWQDGWRHLRFLLIYSPRWLFLYPGMLAALVGLGVSAWLLQGPKRAFGVVLDVDTLVYFLGLLIIGIQLIGFAVCGKVYATVSGLLPPSRGVSSFLRMFPLERTLRISALIVAMGLTGAIWSVTVWRHAALGNLDASQMLRLTLPSMLGIFLGIEFAMLGFFLNLLTMPIRSSLRGQGDCE